MLSSNGILSVRTLHGDSIRSARFDEAALKDDKWQHVVITHTNQERTPFAKSEVRLYINGVMVDRAALKYTTFETLSMCGIGSNARIFDAPPALGLATSHSFHGQLASVHLVDDCLLPDDVAFVYGLGANHAGAWGDVGGSER